MYLTDVKIASEERRNTKDIYTRTTVKKYLWGLIKRYKTAPLDKPHTVGDVLLLTESKLLIGGIYMDENWVNWQAIKPYTLRNCSSDFRMIYKTPKSVMLVDRPFREGM